MVRLEEARASGAIRAPDRRPPLLLDAEHFWRPGLSGVTFPVVEEVEKWKIAAMGWCLVFLKGTLGEPRCGR